MRKASLALFICLFLFFQPKEVSAVYDPLSVPNNKFGIHLQDENDIPNAAQLLNSSGGDWGYVTMVIRKDDRDITRWQRVFDQLRRTHLIPIIRIASSMKNDYWEKLTTDDTDSWVYFLNSLNWVVKNRYVVVGNEPNHAKEWGGELNPEEYAVYLKEISTKLKNVSPDFFIMSAGMDSSAPNSKDSMTEDVYLKKMLDKVPDLFSNIDGLASHSYPNPGFSGSEDGYGRGSVRSYLWELQYLKSLKIDKKLPVFITETGWIHSTGDPKQRKLAKPESLSDKYEVGFLRTWNDDNVVAVTPFILNFKDPPFENFSWQKDDGTFYEFYDRVKSLPKSQGKPTQEDRGRIVTSIFPPFVKSTNKISGLILINNLGQSIWYPNEISIIDTYANKHFLLNPTPIEPGESKWLMVDIYTGKQEGINTTVIRLIKNNKGISDFFDIKYFSLESTNIWYYIEKTKAAIVEKYIKSRVFNPIKVQ